MGRIPHRRRTCPCDRLERRFDGADPPSNRRCRKGRTAAVRGPGGRCPARRRRQRQRRWRRQRRRRCDNGAAHPGALRQGPGQYLLGLRAGNRHRPCVCRSRREDGYRAEAPVGRRTAHRRFARATSPDRGEDSGLRAVARFRAVAAEVERRGQRGRPGAHARFAAGINHPRPADRRHPGRLSPVDDLWVLAKPVLSRSAVVPSDHGAAFERGGVDVGLRRARLPAGRGPRQGAAWVVSNPVRLGRRRAEGPTWPADRAVSGLLQRGHRRPANVPGRRDAPRRADPWRSWPPRASPCPMRLPCLDWA